MSKKRFASVWDAIEERHDPQCAFDRQIEAGPTSPKRRSNSSCETVLHTDLL